MPSGITMRVLCRTFPGSANFGPLIAQHRPLSRSDELLGIAPVSAGHGVRAKNDLQFWSFCCVFHDLVVHRQDLFHRSKSLGSVALCAEIPVPVLQVFSMTSPHCGSK